MLADVVVAVTIFACMYFLGQYSESKWVIAFKDVGINFVIGVIIAYSAVYIATFVKNKTNQKPNSCLLYFHIFNLVLEISATVLRII